MDDLLNSKGFKIIFWNVRSILKKLDSSESKLSDNNIAVLVVTESWLKPVIPAATICIEGYTHYGQFVNEQGHLKRGGGIIIYFKNLLLFYHVHGDLFNVSTNDIELCTICIKRPHTRRLYLCSVYRPPSGNVQNCVDVIDNCVKFLPHIDKSDLFIGGDFNINFQKSRQENTKKTQIFCSPAPAFTIN